MRKGKIGSVLLVGCGVLLASAAFAADQAAAPPGGEAVKPAAVKEDKGALEALFSKLAPKFGGDANLEYDGRDSNFGDGLTSRVRLTMDADIDPLIYIHTRLTAKQYVYGAEHAKGDVSSHPAQAAGYENEAVKVGMEQLYLGTKFGQALGDTELRVGRQPLWLANGMLADINGINSALVRTSFYGVNAFGMFGVKGNEGLYYNNGNKTSNLGTVEVSKAFGPVEVGGTYLKIHDTFYAANANYATPFKAVLFGQYAHNATKHSDNDGYWGGVRYGNAGTKGQWDASLAYVHVESNINPGYAWQVNDGNLVGAEGARLKAHYALSNWSTLTLVQDFTRSIIGDHAQKRTDVELEVRF